eukprot:TRINITY_DN64879_c0_g1_i1.p1 TRINITY_DN64879_c0_g1~~TRINITY_DN64879_c0_g1_i1.p1  ORF type:complete len:269 (+),score=29.66 TRINITY_DN64879_c0_g1_i1:82-888(+)
MGAEPGDPGPRQGTLSWDDYFMSIAFLTAMRSKDPSMQVGACIVNGLNRIIGVGYNGMPSGCPNEELPWAKTSPQGYLETKYPYVVHAEVNAIMNKNAESCIGCRLYCTLFPCNECAKVIIQAGITHVIYTSDKHHERESSKASRRLFELAGVKMTQHIPEQTSLLLPLRYADEDARSHKGAVCEGPCSCSGLHRPAERCRQGGDSLAWSLTAVAAASSLVAASAGATRWKARQGLIQILGHPRFMLAAGNSARYRGTRFWSALLRKR